MVVYFFTMPAEQKSLWLWIINYLYNMTDIQFNEAMVSFQQIETPTAEQVQEILIKFLDFLEAKCQNEKLDKILEDIEQRVIDDKFGIIPFLLNFIKLKRAIWVFILWLEGSSDVTLFLCREVWKPYKGLSRKY